MKLSHRGVTLIEVLMTVVITSIAMFALAMPLIAEGSLFRTGKRRTEAQRDAEVALRGIARVVREGSVVVACGTDIATFTVPCGTETFHRHPGGILERHDCNNNTTPLIDGARSQATSFVCTQVSNKLVRIQLNVSHHLATWDPLSNQETEQLVTELFLRNG